MNKDILKRELKRDEGTVLEAYQDHLGYWTIGTGRLIDARRGGGISEFEADFLLANDIAKVERQLESFIPYWHSLNDVRQRALANMAFQLGINGLLRFKKMLSALSREAYTTAYDEALNSRWAEQTPERANRVARMILTGEDQ